MNNYNVSNSSGGGATAKNTRYYGGHSQPQSQSTVTNQTAPSD